MELLCYWIWDKVIYMYWNYCKNPCFHFFLTRGKAKAGECTRPGGWVPRNTSVLLGAIGVRRGYIRVIYGQIGLRV